MGNRYAGVDQETLKMIALANADNPYVDITPFELKLGVPIIYYKSFFPEQGETVLYVAPATVYKDKERVVGHTGKSAGVSVRVAKGVTLHSGGHGGRPIRGTVRSSIPGDLIITNQRLVFVGDSDGFEYRIQKVSAVRSVSENALAIQIGNITKNIMVTPTVLRYTLGFINYAVTLVKEQKDPGLAYMNRKPTPEEEALCDKVRKEAANLRIKIPKAKGKRGWGAVRVLMILVLIMLGAVIGIVVMGSIGNRQSGGALSDYSAMELLSLPEHPRVFETMETVNQFYGSVNDRRIAIGTVNEIAKLQRQVKITLEDPVVMYLTEDATDAGYLGTVEINLFDSSTHEEMTLEKAVSILASYLPADFASLYKLDAAYQYEGTDGTTIYTYACRLNEAGIEHRNTEAPQYSYYYTAKIYQYADGQNWKLETNYSAYGDKDVGWIDKYTKPWSVDFADYT